MVDCVLENVLGDLHIVIMLPFKDLHLYFMDDARRGVNLIERKDSALVGLFNERRKKAICPRVDRFAILDRGSEFMDPLDD